ncbi:uncharacterized protein LOC119074408 [Bradysia coprophila]|uniref:uncharacterized protein LOC119074408 n=1 Tax=Bradysia coprophila TaxID=38358 RepID=UPI00187DC8B3|nr:uncharacterized protein LOC119074408 [Bradysia coprophila]
MKFIYVAIIVSALALSLCSCSNSTVNDSPFYKSLVTKETFRDRMYFSTYFEHLLKEQFFQTQSVIVNAWKECSEHFYITDADDAIDIFKNPPLAKNVKSHKKCLYNCIMNRTGVMTDDGFQEGLYMKTIRQLRLNYTSFNIDEKRGETKLKILKTVKRLAKGLNRFTMCSTRNSKSNRDDSEYLLESYARAAHKCKQVEYPEVLDRCEDSWNLMNCIIAQNQQRNFDSPFYPLWVKDLK